MEACPSDQLVSDNDLHESWHKHGDDVMINITVEAMQRLLVDPLVIEGRHGGTIG